jgi:hypothetical protein
MHEVTDAQARLAQHAADREHPLVVPPPRDEDAVVPEELLDADDLAGLLEVRGLDDGELVVEDDPLTRQEGADRDDRGDVQPHEATAHEGVGQPVDGVRGHDRAELARGPGE